MNTSHSVTIAGVEYRTAKPVTKGDVAAVVGLVRRGYSCRAIAALSRVPMRVILAIWNDIDNAECPCGRPSGHGGRCSARRRMADA